MRSRASLLALIAELDGDIAELGRFAGQNRRAWDRIEAGAHDEIDWGALGFTLHRLYGVFENYFLRVSKFFENDLPRDRWHRALLDKMRLEIGGVRPALLTSNAEYSMALELLRFRHRFRNLYGEELDPEKTTRVQKAAAALIEALPGLHESFTAKLHALGEGLP